jgi:hypothetical protein
MNKDDLMQKIAKRAEKELQMPYLTTMMDLHFCMEKQSLDLQKLLNFEWFDFAHDIFGINRHLNHETYILEDCFLPRSAPC